MEKVSRKPRHLQKEVPTRPPEVIGVCIRTASAVLYISIVIVNKDGNKFIGVNKREIRELLVDDLVFLNYLMLVVFFVFFFYLKI